MIYLNSQIYSQLEAASVDIELEKKDLQSFVYLFDEGGAERKQVSNATRISRNMKKKEKKRSFKTDYVISPVTATAAESMALLDR